METNTHRYKPLQPQSREIRLVYVSPGFWDDEIACKTDVFALHRAPAFSALSYAWGDPNPMEFISLDEEIFQVRSNLAAALRHLRHQTEFRTLWIDLLCIDQNNTTEKSLQVNMMGDIYRACEKVLLWLGTESEDSDKWCEREDSGSCEGNSYEEYRSPHTSIPPDRFSSPYVSLSPERLPSPNSAGYRLSPKPTLSPRPHGHYLSPHSATSPDPYKRRQSPDPRFSPRAYGPPTRRQHDQPSSKCQWHNRLPRMSEAFALVRMLSENLHLNEIPGFVNLTSSSNIDHRRFVEPIQALNAMMRRSWWQRIWTVQEATLPRDGILMCGSLEMPWATMTKAAANWRRHANSCCSLSKEKLYAVLDYATHGEPTYITLSTFQRNLLALETVRPGGQESGEQKFMRTFRLFSNRHSTDPRDKVYGLLGILGENHQPISADYKIKMSDLNDMLSRKLLLSGQFAVLYGEARHLDHGTGPSWAKNFGQTLNRVDQRTEDLRNNNRQDYKAASSKPAAVQVCGRMGLTFATVWVDEVSTTSRVFRAWESKEDMQAFFHECAGLINFASRKEKGYSLGGTVKEAFLRTAFGDRCRSSETQSAVRRPREAEKVKLKEWIWDLADVSPETKLYLGNNIKYNICNRAFFTTKEGLMGFGPSNMRSGDEVWVLFGAKVPVILRPLETTINREENCSGTSQSGYVARRHREVVGDCYVHGIMEGEMLGQRKEMTVVLR